MRKQGHTHTHAHAHTCASPPSKTNLEVCESDGDEGRDDDQDDVHDEQDGPDDVHLHEGEKLGLICLQN